MNAARRSLLQKRSCERSSGIDTFSLHLSLSLSFMTNEIHTSLVDDSIGRNCRRCIFSNLLKNLGKNKKGNVFSYTLSSRCAFIIPWLFLREREKTWRMFFNERTNKTLRGTCLSSSLTYLFFSYFYILDKRDKARRSHIFQHAEMPRRKNEDCI